MSENIHEKLRTELGTALVVVSEIEPFLTVIIVTFPAMRAVFRSTGKGDQTPDKEEAYEPDLDEKV